MLLACCMCKSAFADKSSIVDCGDSCMYNSTSTGEIPDFSLHDVTATMTTKYEKTARFAELRLSDEQNRLFAAVAQPQTVQASGNIILACEEVLDQFATRTWPNDNLDELKFPIAWRRRLAKAAIRITTVDEMRKELLPVCNLRFSSLNKWAGVLVSELIATVRVHTLPPTPPPIEQGHDIDSEIPRPSAFDPRTSASIVPNGINEREIPGTTRVPVDKAPGDHSVAGRPSSDV